MPELLAGVVLRKLLLLAFALLVFPALASAQSIPSAASLPTGHRPNSLHIFDGVAIGVNPLVLGDQLKVYYKMPWGEGRTLLTSDSHWRAGFNGTFSPTYIRPAVMIGVSPLLILDIDLHYGPAFNMSNYYFDSVDDNYDAQNFKRREQSFGIFHQTTANTTLKAAVGPVAVLEMFDAEHFDAPQPYFNWETGALLEDGYTIRSKTFLLYEFVANWRVFVNYEWFRYFGSDYQTQLVSAGVFLAELPWHTNLMIQNGYHVQNPQFNGYKFWAAMFREWDFPCRDRQSAVAAGLRQGASPEESR